MSIKELLVLNEDLRLKPYKDINGIWTWGIGRNLEDNPFSLPETLMLLQEGPTEKVAYFCLDNDIERCTKELNAEFGWFARLGEVRQAVLIDMCFNMGIKNLLAFQLTLPLIEQGRYPEAAREMSKSLWARVNRSRSLRDEKMMTEGQWIT